ncbi:hypothetical protein KM043_003078 [Ampulex compressa]|nr:hypothetical protein KM043_003078 [Ampulex compressa]
MSEKQDSGDEIQVISHKFRSATTIEPIFNGPEQLKTLKMTNSSTPCNRAEGKPIYAVDDNALVRNLPELNLPEKILFVIDTAKEQNCTPFKLGTGAKYAPLFMIKRVVETFVSAKSTIRRAHEYALMAMDSQSARWICDFTNNIKSIVNHLDTILEENQEEEQSTYDLGQLFEKIQARLPLPARSHDAAVPTFATRIILLYARSNCIPTFLTSQKCLESLTENPYFFLDVLFVHEPPCSDNLCEDVYAALTMLDTTTFSYILEVGRNAAKLHDHMAKLLAHPLQRPPQKDARYTVYSASAMQEVHTNV